MKCDYCGKEFIPKTRSSRFCSDKCSIRWHRYEKGIEGKGVGEAITCVICGKTFTKRAGGHIYCSEACKKEGTKRKIKEREKEKQKKRRTAAKNEASIADIEKQADALGISYGQLVGLRRLRQAECGNVSKA